ncbi:MAG: NAD(P)/FAD-dependent oxidoreductase [Planctomycetota bacterium]|nr:MAG: NAD(P)/FAD-dependent oxidoreductase [Planctomycetota bacterium]
MKTTLESPTAKVGRPYRTADDLEAFDAVVIGSGMGSLTAAGVLARAGKRVLVLERHYTPGGFTHVFKRPGCEWDVGLHYVGQLFQRDDMMAGLFDYVTQGGVEWAPMDPVYDRIICQGESYDLVAGKESLADSLKGSFPADARAIDRYLDLLYRCPSSSTPYFMEKALPGWLAAVVGPLLRYPFLRYAKRTTYDTLRRLTTNEKLIGVLTAQYGDYGLPPRQSSFGVHAMVARHYLEGAAYPVGGASRIAAAIHRTIESAGGQLLVRAEVRRIVTENGRAVGVEMADGRLIRAPRVISGTGIRPTTSRLLAPDDAARLGFVDKLERIGPSCTMLCLFVALDGADEEFGIPKTNLWVHDGFDHDASVERYLADSGKPFPLVYLSFQSAKDPSFAERYPNTSAVQVLAPANYGWFDKWEATDWHRRGEAYEAWKHQFTERLLGVLHQQMPATRGRVKHAELGTPLSIRHFANHPKGETYGLAHTPERFALRALRPQARIPGLYFTGVDVSLCGIAGAMVGGYLTASAVLGKNAMAAASR